MYLFGFGSLININSAQKSFQRVLKQEDLIPVQIKGYERVWNALESIEFDNVPTNGVFLNIKKSSMIISIIISILCAFLTGHVLATPAVSIFISVILVVYYNEFKMEE